MKAFILVLQSGGSSASELRPGGRGVGNVVRLRRRVPRRNGLRGDPRMDLWRLPTEGVGAAFLQAAAASLDPILAFGESRWKAAVAGDAAAAISLAVEAFLHDRPAALPRTLALSALWLCAARGDPAAELTLRFLKSRMGAAS